MENLKNRVDVRLVTNEKDYLKWSSKPSFVTQNMFDSNLAASHKIKTNLTLNKQAYAKMCILELSNVSMYEFQYDYIKNKYSNKATLLLNDTDSLMYEIETENVNDDFSENKVMFALNNYSAKSKYYDDSNVLVVGKMKTKDMKWLNQFATKSCTKST